METPSNLVEPISQLAPRSVSWLWPGRLARGKLSVFDGDPEIGKSLITLHLCACITTGRPFPDGSPGGEPSNVLIMNGEDATEDTVVPRLRALGADLNRVFVFRKDFIDRAGPFRLPAHTDFLERAMAETGAVFAVLDPVIAFLDDSINVFSDMSVRRALGPLAAISARHGCHTMLARHLNKSGDFHSLYRGGGSIAFVAACRSAFLCARDPHDPLRSIMAQIKNNLGPRQPSLAYRIEVHDAAPPTLDWLGESPLSADQLLAASGVRPVLPGPCDRARDFLAAFLDDGPRTTLDIWKAAQEQALNKRTLQRAAGKMSIRNRTIMVRNRRLTYWLLPNQNLPRKLKADALPDIQKLLQPLIEKYPTTPIDGT